MSQKSKRKGKSSVFVKKLLRILQNKQLKQIVDWVPQGNGFQIFNVNGFNQKILPVYFNHSNLASFVRQLNMYGFTRPKESQQYVYCHPKFKKGSTNTIRSIKRKPLLQNNEKAPEVSTDSNIKNMMAGKEDKVFEMLYTLVKQNQELKNQNKQLTLKLEKIKTEMSVQSKIKQSSSISQTSGQYISKDVLSNDTQLKNQSLNQYNDLNKMAFNEYMMSINNMFSTQIFDNNSFGNM